MSEREDWRRLDPRTAIATGIGLLGIGLLGGVPTLVGASRDGGDPGTLLVWAVPIALLALLLGVAADLVRCRRTTFRVAPDRFEVLTALLGRHLRTLPRERIRVVDLTADPLARVLGLVTVSVSTGDPGSTPVRLRAVRAAVGRELRATLLERVVPDEAEMSEGAAGAAGDGGGVVTDDGDRVLVALRPAWIGYGVVSFAAPALGAAAVGGVVTVAGWFGLQSALFDAVQAAALAAGLALAVALGVGAVVVVGVVGALAVHGEMWWSHRLTRGRDAMLRVRRGLLTTRAITIEERRVRGVELVEPWAARQVGAARVDVLVTGMRADAQQQKSQDSTVLPPAPRAVALDVAGEVLHSDVLDRAQLQAHPAAALRRRRVWALAAVALGAGALAVAGWLLWTPFLVVAVVVAVLGVPVGLLAARAAWRALGNAVVGEHLVVRAGVLRRVHAVLEIDAVIGVTVRRTPFQHRVGLATLVVATGAGSGSVVVRDVAADRAVDLARQVCAEALDPLLDGSSAPVGVP